MEKKNIAIVYLSFNDLCKDFILISKTFCDIIIVDSGSEPENLFEISKLKIPIITNQIKPWDAGAQRNFAFSKLKSKYKYLLFLDADEVITKELWDEIISRINKNEIIAGTIPSLYIVGKPLTNTCKETYHDRLVSTKLDQRDLWTKSPGEVLQLERHKIYHFKNGYHHYVLQKGYFHWLKRMLIYPFQNGVIEAQGKRQFKNYILIRRYKFIISPILPLLYFLFYLIKRRCFKDSFWGLHFALIMSLAQITYLPGYLFGLVKK